MNAFNGTLKYSSRKPLSTLVHSRDYYFICKIVEHLPIYNILTFSKTVLQYFTDLYSGATLIGTKLFLRKVFVDK